MSYVTTVRYTVRFNGVLLDTFLPLSPYLFLFIPDGLSKVLQQGVTDRALEGLRVCLQAPEITSLLFADDSLLFFRASLNQTRWVKEALNRYCRAIGQLINFDKCSILCNENQGEEAKDMLKRELNVRTVSFEAKYLGLPTPEGRLKAEKFQALTERLTKRCNAWDEKCLSAAGKEVLIKSVAQAIPVYVMSVFLLPAALQEVLERRIRQFW